MAEAWGQNLSFGVIGGGSVTNAFQRYAPPGVDVVRLYSESKDYLVGPMVEWRLSSHWSIEVDGLYRKLHLTEAFVEPNGMLNSVSPSPVITWEFPMLGKYRFSGSRWRPFVEGGPSFRTAGNLNGTAPSQAGATGGLGVELHAGGLTFAPAVRYTRWTEDNVKRFGSAHSKPDQVEMIVGVSRSVEVDAHPLGRYLSMGAVLGTSVNQRTPVQRFNESSGNDTFASVSTPDRSFNAGPMLEILLAKGFSVEADALYVPLRAITVTTFNGTVSRGFRTGVTTWELPVLGRYAFRRGAVAPFGEIGPAFRLPTSGISTHGISAGIGARVQVKICKIQPVVRYTRWAQNDFGAPTARADQVEILVGITL